MGGTPLSNVKHYTIHDPGEPEHITTPCCSTSWPNYWTDFKIDSFTNKKCLNLFKPYVYKRSIKLFDPGLSDLVEHRTSKPRVCKTIPTWTSTRDDENIVLGNGLSLLQSFPTAGAGEETLSNLQSKGTGTGVAMDSDLCWDRHDTTYQWWTTVFYQNIVQTSVTFKSQRFVQMQSLKTHLSVQF